MENFPGHGFFTGPQLRKHRRFNALCLVCWVRAQPLKGRRAKDLFRGLRAGLARSSPDCFRRLPQENTPNGPYPSAEVRPPSCNFTADADAGRPVLHMQFAAQAERNVSLINMIKLTHALEVRPARWLQRTTIERCL